MTGHQDAFSRRGFVQSTLSLLGGAGGVSPASHNAVAAEASQVPRGSVAVDFVRMRGRTDGKAVYWIMRGVRYLWSGADVIPLHNVAMLTAVRFEPRTGGEFYTTILENSVSTDLHSHEPVTSFTNPLTGKSESIWAGPPLPPVIHTLGADGRLIPVDGAGSKNPKVHGRVRYNTSFSNELSMEDRFNAQFREKGWTPDYASQLSIYRTINPTLVKDGSCYDAVTKTFAITRKWSFGGADQVPAPQLLGLYEGRRFFSFEEAFAEPGTLLVEKVGPGTLKAISEF